MGEIHLMWMPCALMETLSLSYRLGIFLPRQFDAFIRHGSRGHIQSMHVLEMNA